jgi:hypothetical protein
MSISILMQIKNDKVSIKTVKFSYYILFDFKNSLWQLVQSLATKSKMWNLPKTVANISIKNENWKLHQTFNIRLYMLSLDQRKGN